jgi:hypothetical protein
MQIETKFLRLFKPAALADHIEGWRVCWIGGWDKCPVLFVVMVEGQRRARMVSRRPCQRHPQGTPIFFWPASRSSSSIS